MRRGRTYFMGFLSIFLLLCCLGCSRGQEQGPVDFFEEYLEAKKSGAKEASPYVYFETEEERDLYLVDPVYLVSYEIKGSVQINDNLTAITFHSVDSNGEALDWTSFVGILDNEYRVFLNVYSVPDELSENLNVDTYTDPDERWLGSFDEGVNGG